MCFKVPAAIYLVLNTIVSSLLSGGISAGITAAMYHPDIYKEVKLFVWPNTLAGNILVTTIAQSGISWFLIGALIRNGQRAKVLGIGRFHRPKCLDAGRLSWFLQTEDLLKCNCPCNCCKWMYRVLKAIVRAVLFGFIMVWLVGWPAVLILLGVEVTSIDEYEYWWLILLIGVYAIVLQVIITPFISYLALASPLEEGEDEARQYEELVPPSGRASMRHTAVASTDPALKEGLLENQL